MKIIVFGASKGLGSYVIRQGLAAGHEMTAFARSPERLRISNPHLTLAKGDVLDVTAVKNAIQDQDAVIITLGLPTLRAMGFGRSRVVAEGTKNIIKVVKAAGVRRLVTETAIGAGDSVDDIGPIAKLAYRGVLGWLFRQKDEQEHSTRRSGLDWTIVRPTALTNGPLTGVIETSDHIPVDLLTHISRADVANCLLAAAAGDYPNRTITVTYPRNRLTDWSNWLKHYR